MNNPAEDVSQCINGRQEAAGVQLIDWLNMSEDQWEEFAEQHLEPLIDVGASPCPPGLVFRGMVIVPTGTTDNTIVFTCFTEPDWQAGQVVSWNKVGAETPEEIELVELAATLEQLLEN